MLIVSKTIIQKYINLSSEITEAHGRNNRRKNTEPSPTHLRFGSRNTRNSSKIHEPNLAHPPVWITNDTKRITKKHKFITTPSTIWTMNENTSRKRSDLWQVLLSSKIERKRKVLQGVKNRWVDLYRKWGSVFHCGRASLK